MVYLVVIVFGLMILRSLHGASYEGYIEDEDIFVSCPKQPKNVLNHKQLFNFSEFITVMNNDIINMSGNFSVGTEFETEPTDRITLRISTYHWEIGVWQPTVFNIVSNDFCKVMYDPNQYWYTYWTQYIINAKEVKDNCINVPGTKFLISPHDIRFIVNANGPRLSGRYKFEFVIEAYDEFNKKRPNSVCFMSTVEVIKVSP